MCKTRFLKLFSLLLFLIFLTACQDNKVENSDDSQHESLSQMIGEDINDISPSLNLELIPHLTRNEGTILLIDLVTGDTIAEHTLEHEHAWVAELFDFDHGYYIALVGISSESHLIHRGKMDATDFDDEDWNRLLFQEHDYELEFLIFDQELSLLEALPVEVNDELNIDIHGVGGVLTVDDGELMLYFSPYRHVTGATYSSIQKYNLHAGEQTTIIDGIDMDINIYEMKYIDDEHLFFISHSGGPDLGPILSTYCVINLATGEVDVETREGFLNLIPLGGTDPYILLFSREEHVADEQWFILNPLTMENEVVQGGEEGLDKRLARLSLDGRHIVTIDEDNLYFRKYEVDSGNLIHEVRIDPIDNSIATAIFPITDSIYAIHMYDEFSNGLFGYQGIHQLIVMP